MIWGKLGKRLSGILGGGKIDENLYEELETVLITADVGIDATTWLLSTLRKQVKKEGLTDATQLKEALKEALLILLAPLIRPFDSGIENPFVIMITGVNGAGKPLLLANLLIIFNLKKNLYYSLQEIHSERRLANNLLFGVNEIMFLLSHRILANSKKVIQQRLYSMQLTLLRHAI